MVNIRKMFMREIMTSLSLFLFTPYIGVLKNNCTGNIALNTLVMSPVE